MAEAMLMRNTKSTDKNHPTGAVLVKEGTIIGRAANQAGFKKHTLIRFHEKGWCVRRCLKVKSGTRYWLCPGCASHENHAEALAVKDAIKNVGREEVVGADLYLYGHWWCCKPCWDAMIGGGIRNVYLLDHSRELFDKSRPKASREETSFTR